MIHLSEPAQQKLFMRTLRVNDIVRSFVYACRNGRHEWPFILLGKIETASYRRVSMRQLQPFCTFAAANCKDLVQMGSCLHILAYELHQLNDAEVEYAQKLMDKFYN